MSQKLCFKWLGLYQIYNVVKDKAIYIFKKLVRLELVDTFVGNELKKFHFYPRL